MIKADIALFALSELLDNWSWKYTELARSEGLALHFIGCSALVRSDNAACAHSGNLLRHSLHLSGRIVLGCWRQHQRLSIQVGQRHGYLR